MSTNKEADSWQPCKLISGKTEDIFPCWTAKLFLNFLVYHKVTFNNCSRKLSNNVSFFFPLLLFKYAQGKNCTHCSHGNQVRMTIHTVKHHMIHDTVSLLATLKISLCSIKTTIYVNENGVLMGFTG